MRCCRGRGFEFRFRHLRAVAAVSQRTSAETIGVGANNQVIEMARQPVMMLYLMWWKNSLQRRHLQQKLTGE